MAERITERSLYQPISKSLEEFGFRSIQEVGSGRGYIDLECFCNSYKFIIEIKIEDPHTKWKNLLSGVAQAWGYSRSTNAMGFIVIEYPASVRRPLVFTPELLEKLSTQSRVSAIVLTDFWTDKFTKITPIELIKELREKIDIFITKKERYVSLDLAVETIRDAILTISGILRQHVGTIDDLINTVVGRFDLFLALSEEKEEKQRMAAIDLSSYLLVNQILFYHIYASLTKKISDLDDEKINSIYDLKEYFKEITDINYKAVYSVDIVSNLPNVNKIIENVKRVIRAIKGVRAASIRHDLIGRIYHESLPFETRKRLATFYTKPVAAELLTGLCIDKWDETVADPACGSGTLLVATYRRKVDLYKEIKKKKILSIGDIEKLHNLFTQEQITGLDIMPFACHLTAVNLSAQTPNVTTNKLRVAIQDSLSLQKSVRTKEFKTKGILLKPFSRTIQETLITTEKDKQTYFPRKGGVIETKGAVSPEGIGEEFLIQPSDVLIMNPPFSDRGKMPQDYREKLKSFDKLIAKCGNQVNLWGFFLALADDLIRDNGRIGMVVPITIAKGKATENIRNYMLKSYFLRYIVKTTKDIAFSEAATFKDMLLIAEKRKPTETLLTGIVFLKKSIDEMALSDATRIALKIRNTQPKKGFIYSDKEFEIFFVPSINLLRQRDRMITFLSGGSLLFRDIIGNFIAKTIEKAGDKLVRVKEGWLKEGYGPRPKGTSDIVLVTRDVGKNRIARANLITRRDSKGWVEIKHRKLNLSFRLDRKNLVRSLRSITNIKNFDITSREDFIITSEYPKFNKIRAVSKFEKRTFNWTKLQRELRRIGESWLVVPDKIDLTSPNTHTIAVFSEYKITPTNMFYLMRKPKDSKDAKILTLYLNSVLFLSQFLLGTERLGGPYVRLKVENWKNMEMLNMTSLSSKEKQTVLNLFQKLRNVEFPSIIEQLENKFWARVELDKTILKTVGFSHEEIDEWLPKLYDTLGSELRAMKEVR